MTPQTTSGTAPDTGKKRASRISLSYFKSRNGLERAKLWLTVLAVVLAGGWLAWGAFVRPDQGRLTYSRGPVHSVHAAWDSQCSACHTDFTPLSEHNLAMSHPSPGDAKCQTCHVGAVHAESQKPESVVGCGGCHREHRGPDVSLVRLPDTDCTSCHRDLKHHMNGTTSLDPAITDFVSAHPQFALFKGGAARDPGRLKFNHRLHLMPGVVATKDARGAYTLGKIKQQDAAAYERYKAGQKDQGDTALVQLSCASCHVLDNGDQGLKTSPRAGGLYYQPIHFDAHCKACHPLTFDAKVTAADGQPLALPHPLRFDDMNRLLWGAYAERWIKDNKDVGEDVKEWLRQPAVRPLPGKPPAGAGSSRDEVMKALDGSLLYLSREQAGQAANYLLQGKTSCGECHHFKEEAGRKTVEPVNVPAVWFEKAKFSHVAHRAMDCRGCHANAYPRYADGAENPRASEKNTDVLIPDIANCRRCHGPAKSEGGRQVGGVRAECTTCHTYHNGEQPLRGLGARRRDPERLLDLQSFLEGKTGK